MRISYLFFEVVTGEELGDGEPLVEDFLAGL